MSVNKVILVNLYVEKMMSIPEISRETGIPQSTVRNRLLKEGVVLRSRADGVRNCKTLGQHLKGKNRHFSDQWKKNISKGRKAWGRINARGFRVKQNGYYDVTVGPNKKAKVFTLLSWKRFLAEKCHQTKLYTILTATQATMIH
jgi:hypothetical protein